MPTKEYIEHRLSELRAMWDTPEIYKQHSALSQRLIRQIEAERNQAIHNDEPVKVEETHTHHGGENNQEVKSMPEEEKPAWNFQNSKQPADLEPFMETESSPSTQGVCPLRLPREPIEGISSVGVDTVFPRDLNRFTLDTLRDVKKYRGPSALISSLEHYTPLFEKAKVFDAKTIEDFRTMIRMLKAAPTPKAKEELFETKITDYLKNISMTRG